MYHIHKINHINPVYSKMATVLPIPSIQDLNVELKESILVCPSQETEKKSIFLSNIDQILNYNIPTAHFFSANPDYPPEIVSKRLKLALERVLVPYDFMAGRFKLNQESGRLEIDCNRAGAGFVVASSEYSLHELGDFVHPNLGFRQLAVQVLDNLNPEDDQPLCIFQVTSFKCGGFAIGMSMNHVLFDGVGAQNFIENLATQAFDDKPLALIPCHNRRLLAARSPPRVEFPIHEFSKPNLQPVTGPPVFDCKREELDYKIFKLSTDIIKQLKENATTEDNITMRISSLTVVIALMWRCKALSLCDESDKQCTILNVIDIRSRLNPPLPNTYCGNAVLISYASAKREEIEQWPFSKLVEMIATSPSRVTDEYAKSVIDWLEIHKGLPCGDYMVSSWLRLKFDQVEYPWGKPVHSGPVVSHRKDICWVFPDVNGVNALVSLPPKEMERFEFYFHKFFE